MEQNFFVTNSENQNYASTRAQEQGGVVLVLGTSVLEAGSITASNNHVSARIDIGNESIWAVKIAEWYRNDENENNISTYSDSGVENELLRTGVAFSNNFLPIGVYAIVLPASVPNQEEAVLSYIADVLRKHGNFAMVVVSNDSTDGSKTVISGDS